MPRKKIPVDDRQERFERKLLEDPRTAVHLAVNAQERFEKRLREEPIREWFPQLTKEAFESLDDENLRQVAIPTWARVHETKYLSSAKAKAVYHALMEKWRLEAEGRQSLKDEIVELLRAVLADDGRRERLREHSLPRALSSTIHGVPARAGDAQRGA
jgi:hypothetical protein